MTLPKPTPGSPFTFTTTYAYDNWDSVSGLVFTTITDPNDRLTKQGYDSLGEGARVPAIAHVTRAAGCVAMMALAGCLACRGKSAVRTIGTPEVSATPVAQRPTDYLAWCDLLTRASRRADGDRRAVEAAIKAATSGETRALAKVLIAEWDLAPSAPQLAEPVPIYFPELRFPDNVRLKRDKAGFALVGGILGKDGFIRDATVVRKSGYPELDEHCLRRHAASRFRPARRGGNYVEQNQSLVCRLEP